MKWAALTLTLLLSLNALSQKGDIHLAFCLPCLVDFVNFPTIQGGSLGSTLA